MTVILQLKPSNNLQQGLLLPRQQNIPGFSNEDDFQYFLDREMMKEQISICKVATKDRRDIYILSI